MKENLYYPIALFILILVEIIYMRIAQRFKIVDRSTSRGSNRHSMVRGGGIVFLFSVLVFLLFNPAQWASNGWFMLGLFLVGAISMADDIKEIHQLHRLIVQFIAVALLLLQCHIFSLAPWWYIVVALIVCAGILNAYNFMDGINGMITGYSLVVLISLAYINQYLLPQPFVSETLLHTVTFSVMIFAFFNFRFKALCLAGDVGSVSIAFIIVYLLVQLIMATGNYAYLIILVVFGVDVVLTIIHRIMLRENISQAHRMHLYQILVNELKWRHLSVSVMYMLLQALILVGFFLVPTSVQYYYLVGVILLLCLVYILFMRRYFHLHRGRR